MGDQIIVQWEEQSSVGRVRYTAEMERTQAPWYPVVKYTATAVVGGLEMTSGAHAPPGDWAPVKRALQQNIARLVVQDLMRGTE